MSFIKCDKFNKTINYKYVTCSMRRYKSLKRKLLWFFDDAYKTFLMYKLFSVLFFVMLCCSNPVQSQEVSSCCSKASGSCKTVCEKMTLVDIAADTVIRDEKLANIYKFCSPEVVVFWECLNQTLQEVLRGSDWWGRTCCELARSRNCGKACATAISVDALQPSCRKSDEQSFFECLDRQNHGQECCSNTRIIRCHEACKEIFKTRLTPTREQRATVTDACEENSPKIMQCIRNYTKVTPASDPLKYLHCCSETLDSECRSSCHTTLLGGGSSQEILDALQKGGCGPPLPHLPLWQCFLRADSQTDKTHIHSDRLGIDSAKLHCCHKANTSSCRKLCLSTFTNNWAGTWERFDVECLKSPEQASMISCIDEVEEPCELGCDGLSYCSNFNNRPTELFRACNKHSDTAAMYEAALWQSQGFLDFPALRLPVRNDSRCSPHIWKTVACTLQIKPCSRQEHATRICREDCFSVLSHCTDWSRVDGDYNAASLCALLSPENSETPCISLQNFMEPSDNPHLSPSAQVSSPCKDDPCNATQVCMINRNCQHGIQCKPYYCTNGCALGEASPFQVPEGTFVRIPISSSQKGCHKICQCSSNGVIDKCQPLPCFSYDNCILANKDIQHGSIFYMECNVCTCFAGEIVCSKKHCDAVLEKDAGLTLHTILPCNCPNHFVPVCGANGKTYPNSCLAKCAGLVDSDIEFGPCNPVRTCDTVHCEDGTMCLPRPNVCLSMMHHPCPQHICVNISSCATQPKDPVCDTEGYTHPSPCHLLTSGKHLAYSGKCLLNCQQTGTVCGINGNTYSSECAAWADFVAVDYLGPCAAIGLISDIMTNKCTMEEITCPPLSREDCLGYTPPGACCPKCGGALKILYSRKQIDRALYALRGHSLTSLTLKKLLDSLQRHVQVAECTVRGYLTVELDIFVLIQSTEKPASELQLETCIREAEKLASLIKRHSARIASELSLSSLTVASTVHTLPSKGIVHTLPLLHTILCSCIYFILQRYLL